MQQKPSARKREHPAIQNMKFLSFLIFNFLWVIFASWIRIQQLKLMRIRIRNPEKYGIKKKQTKLIYKTFLSFLNSLWSKSA